MIHKQTTTDGAAKINDDLVYRPHVEFRDFGLVNRSYIPRKATMKAIRETYEAVASCTDDPEALQQIGQFCIILMEEVAAL